jgi:hypothetical protein
MEDFTSKEYFNKLNSTVYKDTNETAIIFDKLLKPKLVDLLGGDVENIENNKKDKMSMAFDRYAGIDAWLIKGDEGIRGIASRIQFGNTNWRSFTIRKERETGHITEFEKRKYAIEHNWIYPYWIIQAFISKDKQKILGFAVAKMQDIIEIINRDLCYERKSGDDQIGKTSFYVIDWDIIKNNNYFLYEE